MTAARTPRHALAVLALLLVGLVAAVLLVPYEPNFWRDPAGALAAICAFAAFGLVGALIIWQRPGNALGWVMAAIGLLAVWGVSADSYADYAYEAGHRSDILFLVSVWISLWYWFPLLGLTLIFTPLLFPDGRPPSRRWRPVVWTAGLALGLMTFLAAFKERMEFQGTVMDNPAGIPGIADPEKSQLGSVLLGAFFVLLFAALASVVVRYLKSGGVQRQQIKWLMLATLLAVLTIVSESFVETVGNSTVIFAVSITLFPVAIAVAIFRYRLYDIDIIINRTLVYGALTAGIVALYVLIVGTLGALLQARGDLAVSLVATGVVAVVFAPLRERLQRSVNRLMYGERDEPYAVLSRLGQRLEATIAPEAALKTIVETIAQALKVPYVAIDLSQDGKEEFVTVAEHGSPKEELVVLPLVYQRETIGRLVVSSRAPGEAFSPTDMHLLEDLVRQVEVAVHAVRLTADLQRSRERLVTTREEERRRLRRDLHDGLGPTLGALTLGLDTTRLALAQDDPKAVDGLLLELKAQAQEAVSDVRRLVYGLRPPALDDLGLVPAIRQQAANHGLLTEVLPNGKAAGGSHSKNGLVFQVEASDDLPPLPAAVEVACYRVAQEAITNASRHAGASSCRIDLSLKEAEGTLQLEVVDDGTGIPEDRSAGVGMTSMRERVEELGGTLTVGALPEGGTRILASLPLPAVAEEE